MLLRNSWSPTGFCRTNFAGLEVSLDTSAPCLLKRYRTVTNCPYEQVSCKNRELCTMDQDLIEGLVGQPVHRAGCQLDDGTEVCTYLVEEDE